MNKKTLLLISLCLFAILFAAGQAQAQPTKLCEILNKFKETTQYIAGALATIFTIVAGIMFLTSVGKPEKANQAKQAMIAIAIGVVLFIVAMSAPTIINEIFGTTISAC